MSATTEVVVGLDLGTTSSKALVRDLPGRQAALVEARTPWTTVRRAGPRPRRRPCSGSRSTCWTGRSQAAEQRVGRIRVLGVGVAGLGESGVLLDAAGEPCAPVIAWFDRARHRAGAAAQRPGSPLLPDAVRAPHRPAVGLPGEPGQAAVAARARASSLTAGTPVGERPRVDRAPAGRRAGPRAVARVPDRADRPGHRRRLAGGRRGGGPAHDAARAYRSPPEWPSARLQGAGLPASLQGAALTVAGHDHPVAAIGVGAVGPDELFNSSGTADVVARSLPGVLDDDRRELLVRSGLSAGAHVLPGTTLLLGGVRGGLLLRRVLGAFGATGAGA